jgi:hypothetical protein
LVTGNPGSGKSTLARELAGRGLVAIDPDYDPELSYWEDDAGDRLPGTEGPATPDEQWLRAHRWVWNRSRLDAVLSQHEAPVFLCGIALNIDQVLDLVDRDGRSIFEAQMLRLGATALDGTASTDQVADQLLALISVSR